MLYGSKSGMAVLVVSVFGGLSAFEPSYADERDLLNQEFHEVVLPFLESYCLSCHGTDHPEAEFDLRPHGSLKPVIEGFGHWELVHERLRAGEMPPEEADRRPDREELGRIVGWIERLRRDEAERHAGDPGPVLARRLSNAEYDYSIFDLVGVDVRPTREFPIDPANEMGFDNTGESLAMSPALLIKYLEAAQEVADHLVLLPQGLDFAPHPAVTYSDRDKYCVNRIVAFYRRQPVDYADYFFSAWRYRYRSRLEMPEATRRQIAEAEDISAKYLETVWEVLVESDHAVGPVAEIREQWQSLPPPGNGGETDFRSVREGCERLRDRVIAMRRSLIPPAGDFTVSGLNRSAQPIILWQNREIAARRQLGVMPQPDGKPETEQLRDSIAEFCRVFPDTFFVSERGRMFLDPEERNEGRLLSAGFHLMVGYFRDDAPLYHLVLDEARQQELDSMWRELDYVTLAPIRQLSDFVYFERAEYPGFLKSAEFDFAREDTDVTSAVNMQRLATRYIAKARDAGIDEEVLQVIEDYFEEMSADIRRLEVALAESEAHHLHALLTLAQRAWRRSLTEEEQADLIDFYRESRALHGLSHEDAVRDTFVSVLMSPRFLYRTTVAEPGAAPQPLSDHELASRLSYFLWSSLPDEELLEQAAKGDLPSPDVLLDQTRRMTRDPRIRRLATEFGGHWLDFRRFESHNGVDRNRFPEFNDDLRQAMYEEPIRFLTDIIQSNRSVLDLIEADHTFVNPVLADHYGIPSDEGDLNQWVRVDQAGRFGRGGLLPMSVFLTSSSPGLRTSPVRRGYWVVRRLLGEHIPAPPPDVPELPQDEADLGELSLRELLARHRETASCAACHSRFDAMGLVFEGYGPIGERRSTDLGGRPVDTTTVFPDGTEADGVDGLREYLLRIRRDEFVDNLCRKLLSYALGRSLLPSDESTIETMKERLEANDYEFGSLLETIVSSPQFRMKRGSDHAATWR